MCDNIFNNTHLTASFWDRKRQQKSKPFQILMKHEITGWAWYQADHMQIICTLLQTDNHASTPSLYFYMLDPLPDVKIIVPMQF